MYSVYRFCSFLNAAELDFSNGQPRQVSFGVHSHENPEQSGLSYHLDGGVKTIPKIIRQGPGIQIPCDIQKPT